MKRKCQTSSTSASFMRWGDWILWLCLLKVTTVAFVLMPSQRRPVSVLKSAVLDDVHDYFRFNDRENHDMLARHWERVQDEHARDVEASRLVRELPATRRSTVAFKTVLQSHHTSSSSPLAILSTGEPLLTQNECHCLGATAAAQATMASSRFTLQRPGNIEVHTVDLPRDVLEGIVTPLLAEKIYPWVRQAFGLADQDILCVYDSLYIRYNATEAAEQGVIGASQPLHKDLGLISVNLLLNEDFEGGGTFLENQLLQKTPNESYLTPSVQSVQPRGVGHALAHWSSERHAGAATVRGVREIMVFFLMPIQFNSILRGARLKNCLDECGDDILCRLQRHYLAARANPNDGEALLYLGTMLMEYSKKFSSDQNTLCGKALELLREASGLCRCDARIFNNLGLTVNSLVTSDLSLQKPERDMLISEGLSAFSTSVELLERYERAGCDVQAELDACRLNFGLFVANLNRFTESMEILKPLVDNQRRGQEGTAGNSSHQAWTLYRYCLSRATETTRPTTAADSNGI